jgi:hypothetical protein
MQDVDLNRFNKHPHRHFEPIQRWRLKMIPASYLFKNTYRQHWEEPDLPSYPQERRSFFTGLMTPIAGAIDAVFTRGHKGAQHHIGGHAYE